MIVALILIERVVLVDILHIGHTACRLIHGIARLLRRKRVTLGAVVVLVAFKDIQSLLIIVVAAIEVVVVAGRVVERRELVFLHLGNGSRVELLAQAVDIVAVALMLKLLSRTESVKTHILQLAGAI